MRHIIRNSAGTKSRVCMQCLLRIEMIVAFVLWFNSCCLICHFETEIHLEITLKDLSLSFFKSVYSPLKGNCTLEEISLGE